MRAFQLGVFALVVLAFCCCEDSTGPSRTLEGTWDLVGSTDEGVSGATTGTCSFRHNGAFAVLGTVTYPGESVDSLDVSGTYRVVANYVTLTTPDGTGTWFLAFSSDRVVLSLVGADPPTRMTLRRQP
jgi:hypothetical protein